MGGGSNMWGQLVNGHPMEAFGNNSKIGQAIDGQPAAALGFGMTGNDKTSGGPAPAAAPMAGPISVPSANNFSPIAANLNNTSSPPPAMNQAANPLATPNAPIAAAANQSSPTANQSPVMAQIQHPEFQNFIQSVMQNVGQSNQPGGS